MKQLDLEDYIKEKKPKKEKKPEWVNSSYEPIRVGDLVQYHFGFSGEDKKSMGLVVAVVPSNVYDSSMCDILDNDGSTRTVKTTWVRKIT